MDALAQKQIYVARVLIFLGYMWGLKGAYFDLLCPVLGEKLLSAINSLTSLGTIFIAKTNFW